MPETADNTDFELSYGHEPKSNPLSIKSNQIYEAEPTDLLATQNSVDLPTMERFHSENPKINLDDYVTVPDEYYDDDCYVQPKGLNSSVDVWN